MVGSAILWLAVVSSVGGASDQLRNSFDLRPIDELVAEGTNSLPDTHYARFNSFALLLLGTCLSRDPSTSAFDPELLERWEESVRGRNLRELRGLRGCDFTFSICGQSSEPDAVATYANALLYDWSELCREASRVLEDPRPAAEEAPRTDRTGTSHGNLAGGGTSVTDGSASGGPERNRTSPRGDCGAGSTESDALADAGSWAILLLTVVLPVVVLLLVVAIVVVTFCLS